MGIPSYEKLEEFGRVRLSSNFFMRDFLYSEIAAWHGLTNLPHFPEQAIWVGRKLCEELLEPLQATFGRIHIRSAYRSPDVNDFGNKNKLNCACNEANYAAHIWDCLDANGKRGATACIVIPWLVDHIERGGSWTDMAWWIHDHLPYSSLYFFPRLAAFNINWYEEPVRRIDSYAAPKGCLTKPGMANYGGNHRDQYVDFPALVTTSSQPTQLPEPSMSKANNCNPLPALSPTMKLDKAVGTRVCYRTIHTRSLWRKVNNHKSLESAIHGKDGAAGLFAHKVRISYEIHGEPLYVLVWQEGGESGFVVKKDVSVSDGIRLAEVPIADLLEFEAKGQAEPTALERYF